MKKKTALLTLVLALAMVLSSISSVFASAPAPQETIDAIQAANVHVSQRIAKAESGKDELTAEDIAINLHNEIVKGKYKVVDTDGLLKLQAKYKKLPIIDTMPAGWWAQRHIPGAYNQIVGANNGPAFEIITKDKATADQPREDAPLLALAKKVTGAKQITKYYNKKTKKWVTKKPAKKYLGKSKKVWINKDKPIVVYCGFTGCARSHQAAMYLRKQGFTNVYRYVGGIAAWVDAGFEIEGSDVDHFRYMNADEWAKYGIAPEDITNADYLIDVRPLEGDNSAAVKGFVPGAVAVPVVLENKKYTEAQQEALKAEYEKADGKRIVIVCVSGNMLAKNAMDALKDAGVDMSNVTYLKGGFGAWSANFAVVAPDKQSVSVPAWVTEGKGPDGKLMMLKDGDGNLDPKKADLTHHVLVNEKGGNAPIALLNTKTLPLHVYNALQEIGGTPCDKFNKADCFVDGKPQSVFLPDDSQKINVSFEYGDGKTATMADFFDHVVTPTAEVTDADSVEVEPYVADMRFGGCLENINDNFESPSGNQTGCITCTFSCWIGTVSNGEYAYNTQEAKVNRANVPAAKTPVTVVYTLGE